MLTRYDVNEETDRRLSARFAAITETPFELLPFTRDPSLVQRLRDLIERRTGCNGGAMPVAWNREEAFFYVCQDRLGRSAAQGIGDSPELAICDAFLRF